MSMQVSMGASPEFPPSLRSTAAQHNKNKKFKHGASASVRYLALPCLPAATGRRLLALTGSPLVRSAVQCSSMWSHF